MCFVVVLEAITIYNVKYLLLGAAHCRHFAAKKRKEGGAQRGGSVRRGQVKASTRHPILSHIKSNSAFRKEEKLSPQILYFVC